MARSSKKMAFYEAMTKAQLKSVYSKKLESLHPDSAEDESATKTESIYSGRAAQLWRKPRLVQFNTGRIEFSVSYPLAIALVLGIILLLLAAFRLGQIIPGSAEPILQPVAEEPTGLSIIDTAPVVDSPQITKPATVSKGTEVPAVPKGSNVIVLVEYQTQADLVPVRKHFTEFGIETEIVNWAGRYFLITKDRFEGFSVGLDGYEAKRKIVEVGALYQGKAPEGYETFAPHFFRDAYGKKVE